MRVISFERRDGSSGVGVMSDDLHFVDAINAMPSSR